MCFKLLLLSCVCSKTDLLGCRGMAQEMEGISCYFSFFPPGAFLTVIKARGGGMNQRDGHPWHAISGLEPQQLLLAVAAQAQLCSV